MAESVLSDIAAGLICKLTSSVLNEIELWRDLKDELHKLNRSISTIESVLLHAEEQSIENPQVKNWLGLLSEAMYDADDLVDEFATEALRQQLMSTSQMAKKMRLFFSSSNQFSFGLKLAHNVRALRERLDEIAAEKNKFHLEERASVTKIRCPTHSSPPQVVIGRDHEKDSIVEVLLSSDYEENVSVVPIVGIGGLGKTTIAQLVYNNHTVQNHFNMKMWVCVSDDFDVQLIVRKILESATRKTPKTAEMEPLKNLLHELINGIRYLLVLDDVWNEDVNEWLKLKDLLAGGARGSKIVITTRLRKVAEMSRPVFIHELSGLPENEAWLLFKQMAFKPGQVPSPSHEAIGREIVGKCCGVPLAIKAIGGMLYFKDLEFEWHFFKNEELSKIDVYRNDILPILKLSYNHLPSCYKHCFAYCSLYPKDFKIPVKDLINLWKAQGYLKSKSSNECLQDVGFGYFMDLFRSSFFQDVEKDYFGNIEYCKMHDLMHDLAISVAGDFFSISHSEITCIKEKTQHMSFRFHGTIPHDIFSLLKAKKIRTVLPLADRIYPIDEKLVRMKEKEVDSLFCTLRCLRVLNLSYMGSDRVPSSICKLKHLRYLDLSFSYNLKKLPDSITYLINLQVLRLHWCIKLEQLPKNITKLINLTHLDNHWCRGLTRMPRGIGKLTQLEKLSTFVVAKDISISKVSKTSGGLDELHALNKLRGELEIMNLNCVKNVASDCKAAHLSDKKHLQQLTLDWGGYESEKDNYNADDEVGLEALRPHRSLKQLSVYSYRGERPPSWLSSITHLVSVYFGDCRSLHWLPPFDQLPYLKKLWIGDLTNLEFIDIAVNFENGGSSSFFPSLTDLTLKNCPNLRGFVKCKFNCGMKPSPLSTEDPPSFPCLSELEIGGCPNLIYMPLSPELRRLELEKDGIKSLMQLLKMRIDSASQSTPSPLSSLSKIEHLSIWEMKDSLTGELLQYLHSLQHLEFRFCSCKSLCSDVIDDDIMWQSLKVLRCVEFYSMPNLVTLPKGLQHVTSLQRLRIDKCDSLASIPEWMGNLIALQHLDINMCPQLSKRYNNTVKEISHIPNISIDNKPIRRNGP